MDERSTALSWRLSAGVCDKVEHKSTDHQNERAIELTTTSARAYTLHALFKDRTSLERFMYTFRLASPVVLLPSEVWASIFIRTIAMEEFFNQISDRLWEIKICLLEGKSLAECIEIGQGVRRG